MLNLNIVNKQFARFSFLILIISFFVTGISYSQISTTNIERVDTVHEVAYDSTLNFPGKHPESIIGQKLYMLPSYNPEGQIVNYRNMRIEPVVRVNYRRPQRSYYMYREAQTSVIGCYDGSDPNLLADRYYDVLDVVENDDRTFLKLLDIENNEHFYFLYPLNVVISSIEYDGYHFHESWPFIIVGHFEKLQDKLVGNSYVLKNSHYERLKAEAIEREPLTNIVTGEDVQYYTGKKWEIKDLTIDEQYLHNLSVILDDNNGQQIILSLNYAGSLRIGNDMGVLELSDYNNLYERYGDSLLTALEGTIEVGFTAELALIALRPSYDVRDINTTKVDGVTHEQWVISRDRFIYLEDGIVTGLQY